MASITFFLKQPNSATTTPIIARVAHAGSKIKVYTGISVEPRKWIQAAQMLQTRGNNQAGRINDTLVALRTRLEEFLLAQLATGVLPSAEQLRQALEPEAAPVAVAEAVPSRLDFWAAYQLWNEEQRGRVSPCTIKTNVTAANHLRNFVAHANLRFDFDALTPTFAAGFTSYLLHEVRLTDNTIAKALARIKCFLRFAHERGFVERTDFKFLKWKKQEPDILTLTLPEVQALETIELTGALDNVRNMFLLACYTGLRYSDLVALRPEHLQNERLRVRMQKTRDVAIIPLRPAARQLLNRLFAGELRPITNQQMNKMLKEIGERAGLTAPVERVRYRGGQRQTEQFQKWECLSCHTARRTYTTLALEQRLRPEVVMRTTGHRTWAAFKRYVAISDDTVEKEFAAVYGGGGELGEVQ